MPPPRPGDAANMFRRLDFLEIVPPLSPPPVVASLDVGDLIAAAVSTSWSDFVLIIPDEEFGLSISAKKQIEQKKKKKREKK